MGSTCNHVAAVLFKVEHAWKSGLTLGNSPTSKECAWNKYGANKKGVEPKRISEMKWKKPHHSKKGMLIILKCFDWCPAFCTHWCKNHFSGKSKQINPTTRQLFKVKKQSVTTPKKDPSLDNLVDAFYSGAPEACAFWYTDMPSPPQYPPEADFNLERSIDVETTTPVPLSLPELASRVKTAEELIQNLPELSAKEVEVLEHHTRGQSQSTDWKSQRVGRITASTSHRVMTMVKSLQDKNDSSSATSLTKLLTGQSSTPENIPALQYGHEMEEEARQHYLEEMKRLGHKDVKVEPCGLFVMQNKSFISASPDAVVSCSCCGKGVLEIKCPYSIANQIPSETNLTYLRKTAVDGKVKLVISHPYYSQVQTQMV